jgi:hypothetical protein
VKHHQDETSVSEVITHDRPVPLLKGTVDREKFVRAQRIVVPEARPAPRRGLNRVEAALYIGISPSKFDEMVRDGRMCSPKRIDARVVWDIRQLDAAFDKLPSDGGHDDDVNSWDEP